MIIYAIKDCKMGFSNSIFLKPSDDMAIRDFTILVNEPGNLVSQFPADFELFCLGSYDNDSGVISPGVRFVCTAASLVGKMIIKNMNSEVKPDEVQVK